MLKKVFSMLTIAGAVVMFSCEMNETVRKDRVSDDVLAQIGALGFSTNGVVATDGGYLVEGDILLHEHDLNGPNSQTKLRIAEVEQYRTFNTVSGTRTITVSVSGSVSAEFSTAVNNMIARYNAENLNLTFARVASGGNINIRIVNTGQYIASAGFPSGGNPYPEIKYAKKYTTGYSDGFMTTVLAHEVGHCIGFRHTDYMNRAYSCGSGGNEGQETSGVGAVHIPGTPTGPDAGSWMLACAGASTNRPFNNNDKTALGYIY
jgi:hypothetical protein